MSPSSLSVMTRTREILEDLEAVRENLLALSDDIWQSIDHNDPDALERGVEFKRAFNSKASAFDVVATDLSVLVQQYTSVRLEEAEESGSSDDAVNERIIADLNREEPHQLDEDFTYKRPHGFILNGRGTTGITTWQRLYAIVLHQLYGRDADRFCELCEHPDFTTNRGNPTFTRDASKLRKALEIRDGLLAESNLSANSIRDVLKRVLTAYEISIDQMQVFLRQDRDAGRETMNGS
jgi:hypothetical protein